MAVNSQVLAPKPHDPGEHWSLAALVSRAAADAQRRVVLICGLVCLGLFVRMFWDNLGHFYYAWTTDENYSHGFLVPLISLYFANQVARRGPVPIRGGYAGREACCSWSPWRCGWSRFRCRSRSWATSPS